MYSLSPSSSSSSHDLESLNSCDYTPSMHSDISATTNTTNPSSIESASNSSTSLPYNSSHSLDPSFYSPSSSSSSLIASLKSIFFEKHSPTSPTRPHVPDQTRKSSSHRHLHLHHNLETLSSSFNTHTLKSIVSSLADTMSSSLNDSNSATMLPSLISSLPNGSESGTFLSVDVGGSTLRIALIALHNRHPHVIASKIHPIAAPIKSLPGMDFFLWIGRRIKSLLASANYHKHISMGLSWSFPIAQLESVSRGTILTMGKGYHVADEIAGWDLNDAFHLCFEQLNLDITLTAIVNDTIASLLSHSYASPSTRAAVILGTGVNSSVVLNDALINTEISLMGKDIFPHTSWDAYLDANVERPGFQPFETKVSGRYLGEVARLVISDLVANNALEMSSLPACFSKQYSFDTALMSELEGLYYTSNSPYKAKLRYEQVTATKVSDKDLATICNVLYTVSNRSAAWIAASIVSLALNLDPSLTCNSQKVTIAYSGTVIEKYSGFKDRCEFYMQQEGRARGLNLFLEPALDGTLYGPAIASAMYAA